MPTVHHLEASRSIRVIWLLEELEVDYEIEHYERNPITQTAPDTLQEIHPLGRSPVLTDEGRTLAESAAILEYVLDRFDHGEWRPDEDRDAELRYRYWMHYAEGTAMPDVLLRLLLYALPDRIPRPIDAPVRWGASVLDASLLQSRIEPHLELWEGALEDRDYLVSDTCTAADIQMSLPVSLALARRSDDASPRARAWLDRMRHRSAFKEACDRVGEPNPLVPDV